MKYLHTGFTTFQFVKSVCIFLSVPYLVAGALLLFTGTLSAQQTPPRCKQVPSALHEISGFVQRAQGDCWALNDSGNPPLLYQVDPYTGKILEIRELPVQNRDWEDLCCDQFGRLFIGDFGNNRNLRRDLRIYRYDPDTRQLDSILFVYPNQLLFPPGTETARHFDCEAMAWKNDSLHLFTKSRFKGDGFTRHYVLPDKPGQYNAILVDSLYLQKCVVTGAGMSPDGQTLALSAYYIGKKWGILPYSKARVYFFEVSSQTLRLKAPKHAIRLAKSLTARQYESVCAFEKGKYWLVSNETKLWQKAAIRRIRYRPPR